MEGATPPPTRRTKRFWKILAGLLLLVLAGFFYVLPVALESVLNRVHRHGEMQPSERTLALHRTLRIVDLHADSLLWGRDLLERGSRGHVDVPRLIEGNVALQAFTVFTKTPRGLNIERNPANSDNVTWMALAQRWPLRTWSSLTERALYQAHRLREMAERSGGKLVLIRSASELDAYLARRQSASGITAGFLGMEGAHALDGKIENLDRLFAAGFRMMSPTHFFDNDVGGSSAGMEKDGLTPLGREMIRRMNDKHMIVDLAHASHQTIVDVLALSTRPVLVSHTGVKGTCNNQRNLSDDEIRAIAQGGGIIGIGFWPTAVCADDARAIARAMRYAANLSGIDHVALGSDFDGAIQAPFDSAHLAELTDALLEEGFTEAEIHAVMGENAVQFLLKNLPQ